MKTFELTQMSNGIQLVVFDDVKPNPKDEDYQKSTQLALENKVDLIIDFGGGSSMDNSKATAILLLKTRVKAFFNIKVYHFEKVTCIYG